jgi:hypothetical protein
MNFIHAFACSLITIACSASAVEPTKAGHASAVEPTKAGHASAVEPKKAGHASKVAIDAALSSQKHGSGQFAQGKLLKEQEEEEKKEAARAATAASKSKGNVAR